MAKRSFLIPLAVALTALSQSTVAAVATDLNAPTSDTQVTSANTLQRADGQNLFDFVLHRAQDGQLVAGHESHYSHSSHHSHSSHYSSR
jgi:hypothetical protein